MNRLGRIAIAGVLLAAVVVIASTPSSLSYDPPRRDPGLPPPDNASDLYPNTAKRTTWAGAEERTEWSVVYLHGFSATRQETAPLAERVAEELGANLFETRLRGHGRKVNPLGDVSAEDWLDDTVEAIAAGAALGDKVVVIGVSTGATLATALLDHEIMAQVDSFVFLSPNFGLRNESIRHSTGPAGRLLTRLALGKTRSWESQNPDHAKNWANHYPSSALIEMVRVMDRVDRSLPISSDKRWLIIYSEDDRTVSPTAVVDTMKQVTARQKELIAVTMSGDSTNHILAGDIMSPDTTEPRVRDIVDFIRRPAP